MTRRRRVPLAAAAAAAVGVLLAGCQPAGTAAPAPSPARLGASSAAAPAKTGQSAPAVPTPPKSQPVRTGHGWNPGGISGPFPTSCRAGSSPHGQPMPDPRCTPGAVDAAVTQASLPDTVCRRGGYTSSVRPPRGVTDTAKRRMLTAYGLPRSQSSKVELDHLVPLALGGSSDVHNLWPETNRLTAGHTNAGGYAANDKDIVEVYLFHAVCTRKAQLTAAQNAIAGDWTTAVAVLHLPPIPAGYQG